MEICMFLKTFSNPMRTPAKSHFWYQYAPPPKAISGTTNCTTTCNTEVKKKILLLPDAELFVACYYYKPAECFASSYYCVSTYSSSLSLITFSSVSILILQWLSSSHILTQHRESRETLEWLKKLKNLKADSEIIFCIYIYIYGWTPSRGSRPLEGATLSREPPRGGSQHPTNQPLPSSFPNKHFANLCPYPLPPLPSPLPNKHLANLCGL